MTTYRRKHVPRNLCLPLRCLCAVCFGPGLFFIFTWEWSAFLAPHSQFGSRSCHRSISERSRRNFRDFKCKNLGIEEGEKSLLWKCEDQNIVRFFVSGFGLDCSLLHFRPMVAQGARWEFWLSSLRQCGVFLFCIIIFLTCIGFVYCICEGCRFFYSFSVELQRHHSIVLNLLLLFKSVHFYSEPRAKKRMHGPHCRGQVSLRFSRTHPDGWYSIFLCVKPCTLLARPWVKFLSFFCLLRNDQPYLQPRPQNLLRQIFKSWFGTPIATCLRTGFKIGIYILFSNNAVKVTRSNVS